VCEEICDDIYMRENRPDYAHKLNMVFLCELLNEKKVTPTEVDNMQIGTEWIDIANLSIVELIFVNSLKFTRD